MKRIIKTESSGREFQNTNLWKDGVDVIASLNVDEEGQLFELDVWKTDFNELNDVSDR